jgi:multiple sugar transport system ATP-binding protein
MIDVLESIGSDVFVYFTRGRDTQVSAAELDELAADAGTADTGADAETVTARLDAATRIREGTDAELWADGAAIHVFDPATGRNLSLAGMADSPAPLAPGNAT